MLSRATFGEKNHNNSIKQRKFAAIRIALQRVKEYPLFQNLSQWIINPSEIQRMNLECIASNKAVRYESMLHENDTV